MSVAVAAEPRVAIICLTRGYDNIENYNTLIERNIAIYRHINVKRRWWPWPLLIFHEGNILPAHQNHIRALSGQQPIFFIDIALEFQKPQGFDETKELDKRWPWGYKCMCRFFAGRFRNYVSEFDYTIRIDEDCILRSWPQEALGRPDALLQTCTLTDESHEYANELLPKITQSFLGFNGLEEKPDFYNHKFPFTNVWIVSKRLFEKPNVIQFLDFLDAFHFSLYYRIGDLPILGVVMNQFLEKGDFNLLTNVEYYHGSHFNTVKSTNVETTSCKETDTS
jgi:hypothetical protein